MDITQPLSAEQRVANVLKAFVEAHPELADDAAQVIEALAPQPVLSFYDVVRMAAKPLLESAEGARAHAAIDAHEAEHEQLLGRGQPSAPEQPAAPAAAPEGE